MSVAAPDDESYDRGEASLNTPDARERGIASIVSQMVEYGLFTNDTEPMCLLREVFFLTCNGQYNGGACPAGMTYDDLCAHLDNNYSAEDLGRMSVYDSLKAVIAAANAKKKLHAKSNRHHREESLTHPNADGTEESPSDPAAHIAGLVGQFRATVVQQSSLETDDRVVATHISMTEHPVFSFTMSQSSTIER